MDGLLKNLYDMVDMRITGTEIFEKNSIIIEYEQVFQFIVEKF